MNSLLLDLISSFEADSKSPKERYEQFLIYTHLTFEKKIKSVRSDTLKNKYKKIQKNILQYIVANKSEIIKNIR